ncbi:LOW QUALITY PROTEIN: hypothetical protein PHMEG_00034945 [Phytophthora megakarya]|uniref:Tyr recombinase domain-containing protein n=1 Tax=Phytophthora megakarya TaxID=4795 RepID=A0A225UPW1_9STRA|nr:LOW QUALITY PROTEIN: hypothetical protein PHMEG_00034945 [Phytophthora megakarya]
MQLHGRDGVSGARRTGSVLGCRQSNTNTLISSLCSPFITGVATKGSTLSAKTVLSAVSHISWYHMRNHGYAVSLHAGHNLAVRGMLRLSPPPRQKLPVTVAILRGIRGSCDFKTTHDRVLWGAAVMGFFFMLRRSEYLADGSRVKPYIIRVNDISFTAKNGIPAVNLNEAIAITIRFRGSKTDQVGSGVTRTLYRSGSRWLCPVLAAWQLVQSSRSFGHNEALCATGIGKVLKADHLSEAIKTAARRINAEPSQFGTHSMRSGGATALFAAGVDSLTIKTFGRWASDAFERYTRMNDTVTRSLSLQMTQGARSRVSPATPEGLRPAHQMSRTS